MIVDIGEIVVHHCLNFLFIIVLCLHNQQRVSDYCLTSTQQFFSYIMARTSLLCTRPTHLVGFL